MKKNTLPEKRVDPITEDYVKRKGWSLSEDGKILLTGKQFSSCQYGGRSLRNPNLRTLMVPTLQGAALLLEGRHFEIR